MRTGEVAMADTGSRDIFYYFEIIRRNRWKIILPAITIAAIAGVLALLIRPIWEIDAIIQPSKIFVETNTGEYVEFVGTAPQQIADQISQESYNFLIARELNIDLKKFPKLWADNPSGTKLVRIVLQSRKIDLGKKILFNLINYLKSDLDRKAKVEIKRIENQISTQKNLINLKMLMAEDIRLAITTKEDEIKGKRIDIQMHEIDKRKIADKIAAEKAKQGISEERQKSILEEMKTVKIRVDAIDLQQKKTLESRDQTEAIALLLYANEIQQSLRYYGTLDEKLSAEKISMENTRFSIRELEENIKERDKEIEKLKTEIDIITTQSNEKRNNILKINNEIEEINNQIIFLGEREVRIDFTRFIKEPMSSLEPVFPKKGLSVILGFLLGLLAASAGVFLREYWLQAIEKRRPSPPSGQ
jgi:LPS O-antigen subunit length determinant protein (WzzB/FepE family)